ncbi:unnamed protein product, partial [Phaeothamnion confervicola]
MRAKKLHVLAALEVERHRKKAMDRQIKRNTGETRKTNPRTRTLTPKLDLEQVMDAAWRGAEAYHFYMLAQRQLHAGEADTAMLTAIRCSEFEDILDPRAVYSLVALCAFRCGHFGVCSRAFVKLETLP